MSTGRDRIIDLTRENYALKQEILDGNLAFLQQQRALNVLQMEKLQAEAERLAKERAAWEAEVGRNEPTDAPA